MVSQSQDNWSIQTFESLLNSQLFFYIISILFIFTLVSIPATSAQQDFCPAVAVQDASMACYQCYQTRNCNQDERCIKAQCCLAKCHPACGGRVGSECSRYSCACENENTGGGVDGDGLEDNTWIVIIGVLVVLGGGLALGIKKFSTHKVSEKEEEKNEKEQTRYILQLSTDHVTVTPDSPARLNVTAWKIVGSRSPAPAPEAAITLTVAAGNEGLSVSPSSGTGSVQVTISLVSQVAKSPVLVTVTASAGKSSVSSQVVVDIPAEYLMEFF